MVKLKLPKARESILPANPLKRMAAFLVDFLILQIIVISTFASYFDTNFPKNQESLLSTYNYVSAHYGVFMQMYYVMIAMSIIILIYFVFMEYKYSQTIGKMLFSLYVESTLSTKLTLWQCILRSIYVIPIFPILLLWMIDPIYLLFKGERLSEAFSKTKTVEVASYGY